VSWKPERNRVLLDICTGYCACFARLRAIGRELTVNARERSRDWTPGWTRRGDAVFPSYPTRNTSTVSQRKMRCDRIPDGQGRWGQRSEFSDEQNIQKASLAQSVLFFEGPLYEFRQTNENVNEAYSYWTGLRTLFRECVCQFCDGTRIQHPAPP